MFAGSDQEGTAGTAAGEGDRGSPVEELRSRFREAVVRNKELEAKVSGLENELAQLKTGTIGNAEGLSEREALLAERENKLMEKRAKLETYVASLEQTRENLISSQRKQREHEERLRSIESGLSERESSLTERESSLLREREAASQAPAPQVQVADEQVKKYQDIILKVQSSLQGVKHQLQESNKALQEREGQLNAISEENARLRSELDSSKAELVERTSALEGLRARSPTTVPTGQDEGLLNRVRELEAQLGSFTQERQRAEQTKRTLEELKSQLRAQRLDLDRKDRELEGERSRYTGLESQFKDTVERMEAERARVKEAFQRLRDSKQEENVQQMGPDLPSEERAKLDSEIGQLREELRRAMDTSAEATTASGADLEESRKELGTAREQLERYRTVVESKDEELIILKGRLDDKEREISELTSKITDLDGRLSGMEGAVPKIKLEEAKEALKEYYQKELDEMRALLAESRSSFEEREMELSQREAELEAQKVLQDDSLKAKDEELAEKARLLETMKEEQERLRTTLDERQVQLASVETTAIRRARELDTKEQELDRRELSLGELSSAQEASKRSGASEEASKKKLQEAIIVLQERLDSLSRSMESTLKDLERKDTMVLKLQDAIVKIREEDEGHIGRLKTYVANDKQNLSKLSALEGEVMSLKESLRDKERELTDTRGAILGAGVEQKEQLSRTLSELEAARARVKDLENAIEERSEGAKAELQTEKEKLKRASQHLAEREETLRRAENELFDQRKLIGMREGMMRLVPVGPVAGEPVEEQYSCPHCSHALSGRDMEKGLCPACGKRFSTKAEEVVVYECPNCSRTLTKEAVAKMECPFCSSLFSSG
ncbi:MAG: hypothetical protein MUC62_05035 [Candidatus Thermoplasmatota archaeon]|nr:hypothetical protein [Candidatus Thermoplasmatota archaeon]